MSEYDRVNAPQKIDNSRSNQSKQAPLQRSTYPAHIIQRIRMNPRSFSYADAVVLQKAIGNPDVCQLMRKTGYGNTKPVQREAVTEGDEKVLQGKFNIIQREPIHEEKEEEPVQMKKENKTGLPDNLKAGVENLSGLSMDDVKVHYNSDKPAQVGALAYTQGTDIHVSPGQEKHLPHEIWHVVQQKEGRVKPTMQIQGLYVNDDTGLEREADEIQNKIPIQRCIRTRDGKIYTGRKDLPYGYKKNPIIGPLAESKLTWLAQSEADVKARGDGRKTPLLSPHRHLIGENHDQSKFDTALSQWGWGAAKLSEGFQTSDEVKDEITVSNQAHSSYIIFKGLYYGMGELENLHPYTLQGVAVYRTELENLESITDNLALAADDVYGAILGSGNLNNAKATWNRIEATFDTERAAELRVFNDLVSTMIGNYERACIAIQDKSRPNGNDENAKLHDLATSMSGLWETLKKSPITFSCRPYWITSKWVDTGYYLRQYAASINAYKIGTLDVFGDGLNALSKAAARRATGSIKNSHAIDQNWANVKGGQNPLVEISKTREIFMATNINNMECPEIVCVGSAHVTNLRGKIKDGKYHNSYDDFVADTIS